MAENNKTNPATIYLLLGTLVVLTFAIFPEMALASKFDLNAGVEAGTKPLIDGIDKYWGRFVAIFSAGGALIGEGDMKQRAVNAGKGALLAGGIIGTLWTTFI